MTGMVRSRVGPTRAPRGNNLATVVPDRGSLTDLILVNRDYWASGNAPSWIQDLRSSARKQLAIVARQHTLSYLSDELLPSLDLSEESPWIVGGHQPELFHPGVWFKNMLIDRLAKETRGFGIHSIIDHDLARAIALRVPARDAERRLAHASMIPLPLERPASSDALLPWNAWGIDRSRIPTTIREIEQALHSVGISQSMVREYLEELGSLSSDINAAIGLSQVRHRMERRNGLGNWEFPMSALCRSDAWLTFVRYCISRAAELNHSYNLCLDEYREREGIRNPTQPVPRLGQQGEWIELPFWIRLPGQYARRRMWVSHAYSQYRIAPGPTDDGPTLKWDENVSQSRWLLWPRALMTTLFLRIFIADLFVHGIGGGQYDRLTDAIIERFLQIQPPKFVTCTATLWLPFPGMDVAVEQRLLDESKMLERERQCLRSAPQQVLDLLDPYQRELAEKHQRLLARIPPRGHRKNWHREMTALKTKIVSAIDIPNRKWVAHKADFEARALEHRVLHSREFSYILFEEQDILDRLSKLA